jgi:hypothetical protein
MQFVPQACSVPLQVVPTIPPVPPMGVPPVPGLPPVCELEQAAARIAKPRPKSCTRAIVIITPIPGQTEPDLAACRTLMPFGWARTARTRSRKRRILRHRSRGTRGDELLSQVVAIGLQPERDGRAGLTDLLLDAAIRATLPPTQRDTSESNTGTLISMVRVRPAVGVVLPQGSRIAAFKRIPALATNNDKSAGRPTKSGILLHPRPVPSREMPTPSSAAARRRPELDAGHRHGCERREEAWLANYRRP